MNPDSNRFEHLEEHEGHEEHNDSEFLESISLLLRPDGTPVPKHWSIFKIGENVVVNNYTFKVAYIGESTLLLEPVSPVISIVDEK